MHCSLDLSGQMILKLTRRLLMDILDFLYIVIILNSRHIGTMNHFLLTVQTLTPVPSFSRILAMH